MMDKPKGVTVINPATVYETLAMLAFALSIAYPFVSDFDLIAKNNLAEKQEEIDFPRILLKRTRDLERVWSNSESIRGQIRKIKDERERLLKRL